MRNKRLRRASVKQERRLAERAGGRVQAGSGSAPGCKGDVRCRDRFRIEAKFTTKKSYSLKLEELLKILSECEGLERPVFVVEFKNQSTLKRGLSWVVIPEKDWEKLINAQTDDDQ